MDPRGGSGAASACAPAAEKLLADGVPAPPTRIRRVLPAGIGVCVARQISLPTPTRPSSAVDHHT
jgi:hypothetical protein